METIDLVENMNSLFRTLSAVNEVEKIMEDVCPHCIVEMNEIDRDGYNKPGPDRDCEPDFITTSISYRCPKCGYETKISK